MLVIPEGHQDGFDFPGLPGLVANRLDEAGRYSDEVGTGLGGEVAAEGTREVVCGKSPEPRTSEQWAAWLDAEEKRSLQLYTDYPERLVSDSNQERQVARDYAGREILVLLQNATTPRPTQGSAVGCASSFPPPDSSWRTKVLPSSAMAWPR